LAAGGDLLGEIGDLGDLGAGDSVEEVDAGVLVVVVATGAGFGFSTGVLRSCNF